MYNAILVLACFSYAFIFIVLPVHKLLEVLIEKKGPLEEKVAVAFVAAIVLFIGLFGLFCMYIIQPPQF